MEYSVPSLCRLPASLHDCRRSYLIDGLLQVRIQLIMQVVILCQRSPLISDLQDPDLPSGTLRG